MSEIAALKQVRIYSDGACSGNPGPGGYGVVLLYNSHRRELSGGFSHTTNNRMELLGAITGLEALKERCAVRLFSDSIYVVNGMRKGWAKKWRANGWRKADKKPALNTDLWSRLLDLAEQHDVRFEWVRGHSGDPENERADRLAVEAGQRPGNPPDPGFVGPD
jgi:ribonuclease HI